MTYETQNDLLKLKLANYKKFSVCSKFDSNQMNLATFKNAYDMALRMYTGDQSLFVVIQNKTN